MNRPILLHIAFDADGRWRVSVGDGATRPAVGTLPQDRARQLIDSVSSGLESRSRVMVPGADQARTRAEEAAVRLASQVEVQGNVVRVKFGGSK